MANIVSFPHNNLRDIPHMLRVLADMIESGEATASSIIAVAINEHDEVDLYGWGRDLSPREVLGLLMEAQSVALSSTSG